MTEIGLLTVTYQVFVSLQSIYCIIICNLYHSVQAVGAKRFWLFMLMHKLDKVIS